MKLRLHRVGLNSGWIAYLATRMSAVYIAFMLGAPDLVENLYNPFIENFVRFPSIDPWSSWVSIGGESGAFPYGWPMLLSLSLTYLIGTIFGSAWIGFFAFSLLLDLYIFLFLRSRMTHDSKGRIVLNLYALSPLPIVCLSLLGSNDFLAMALLASAFAALVKGREHAAGILVGLAVGVKLMLIVAFVIMFIYLVRSQKPRRQLLTFAFYSGSAILFSLSPIFYSQGFLESLGSAEDALGPLSWGVESPSGNIQILPIIVLAAMYGIWLWRRMNSELLLLALAAPLLLIANLPGAPLGWSLWVFPLLLTLALGLPKRYLVVASLAANAQIAVFLIELVPDVDQLLDRQVLSGLGATASLAVAAGAATLFWIGIVSKSDFLKLRDRPALVLISGDSGVGKDTLAEGLSRSLGVDSTVRLSGDDYHLWDRGVAQWDYTTHLNPSANELTRFFNDVLSLVSGKPIEVGHYDHKVGRRISSRAASSREFVVASGLHALWSRDLNKLASLKVFLEMSDDLRVNLKTQRDQGERGHTKESVMESIARRYEDSNQYILPQALDADLVVRTEYYRMERSASQPALRVTFRSAAKLFDDKLYLELTNTCGLEVEDRLLDNRVRELTVAGETNLDLLQMAFSRLEPRVSRILGGANDWDEGLPGVIQMVTMVHLANNLRLERLIN